MSHQLEILWPSDLAQPTQEFSTFIQGGPGFPRVTRKPLHAKATTPQFYLKCKDLPWSGPGSSAQDEKPAGTCTLPPLHEGLPPNCTPAGGLPRPRDEPADPTVHCSPARCGRCKVASSLVVLQRGRESQQHTARCHLLWCHLSAKAPESWQKGGPKAFAASPVKGAP